jgi:putative DNA primase/helicase
MEFERLHPTSIPIHDHMSAVGAVNRLQAHIGKDLLYNGSNFYLWQGSYWQEVPLNIFERLSDHFMGPKWSKSKMADFLKLLGLRYHDDVNKNPLVVHLENYVFDVATMQMAEPEEYKQYNMIGHLPIEYIPGTQCMKWKQFLNEVMQGNEHKIQLIQEFFGYCFLADNRYQQALVLLGSGNNGKSVLLEVMTSLFDKVSNLDLKQIEDERYVHQLQGSWLNVTSELQYKSMETTAYIKAVIAGEVIHAAPKYNKGFSFRPRAKVAFATNGLPRNNDTSQGYFRRLLIINMAHNVTNPDTDIIRKLKEERSGIFNWALEGLKRLMDRGRFDYENPYLELYKEESSSLYAFWMEEGHAWLKDQIKNTLPGLSVSFSTFYDQYCDYCEAGKMRPAGRNKIRSELERLQIPIEIYKSAGGEKCIKLA